MEAFTLRLEPNVSRRLHDICRKRGYKKTGLVNALIRDFLDREQGKIKGAAVQSTQFKNIVGIVSLGGDAVKDADDYFA